MHNSVGLFINVPHIETQNALLADWSITKSALFAGEVRRKTEFALKPYLYNTVDKWCQFLDETDALTQEYETKTIECVEYQGKYYERFDLDGFRILNGTVYEETTDHKLFLSPKAQKMRVVTIPYTQFCSFKKYAGKRAVYNKEKKAWGSWYNPFGAFDYGLIGGGFANMLLVKDTCEECIAQYNWTGNGVNYTYGMNITPAPEGYKFAFAARVKDIEFEKMAELDKQCRANRSHDIPTYISEYALDMRLSALINASRTASDDYYERYLTFDNSDNWKEDVYRTIRSVPNDTVLTILDCHS